MVLWVGGKRKGFFLNLCCNFGEKVRQFSDAKNYKFWNSLNFHLSLTIVNLRYGHHVALESSYPVLQTSLELRVYYIR